jgi:DNA repair protein RadC
MTKEINNFNYMSNTDLLTLSVNENVAIKLAKYSLPDLSKMSYADLINEGLTRKQALVISSIFEISRRKTLSEIPEKMQIISSNDAADIFKPVLSELPHEEFWILLLNRANRIIKLHKISQGGISGTVSDVRIILKEAVLNTASGIICAHNHPSGNMQPSESDVQITKKIKEASNVMDIQLLDHIIICGSNHFSFADDGLL